jgi:hypothetical protein
MNGRSAYLAGLGLLLAGLTVTPASAQEAGDIGVTVSAPSAIGVIWHVTPRLAIRPDLAFSFGESDGEGSSPDLSSHTVSLGGSVLFYTGRWDNFQTYVTPRLSYSWSSSSSDGSGDFDATQNAWGLSGAFGGQYALGTRFAVFAEAGLAFSSQTAETSSSFGGNDRTSWAFGTRTAVGATLYF